MKKKKKAVAKVKLSFGVDDEDEDGTGASTAPTPRSMSRTPDIREEEESEGGIVILPKKLFGARQGLGFAPKARTKAALQQEAEKTEQLRKEFIATRDVVKKTEIIIPFVFYDGAITPGGKVKVKKGDHVWLFLDKARKMGAELGVGGERASSNWARVSVDDLMMVRDEIILPHVSSHRPFLHAPRTDISEALRILLLSSQQNARLQRAAVQFLCGAYSSHTRGNRGRGRGGQHSNIRSHGTTKEIQGPLNVSRSRRSAGRLPR